MAIIHLYFCQCGAVLRRQILTLSDVSIIPKLFWAPEVCVKHAEFYGHVLFQHHILQVSGLTLDVDVEPRWRYALGVHVILRQLLHVGGTYPSGVADWNQANS